MTNNVLSICEHCAHRFELPESLAGSLQNCPSCGRATKIEGLNDPTWVAAKVIFVALALSVVGFVAIAHGVVPAVLAFAIVAGGGLILRSML